MDRSEKYLQRLGIKQEKPSLLFLSKLHRAHLEQIPYETFSLFLEPAGELKEEHEIERIFSGRGGYCYQLNTAFAWLLSSMGFEVKKHLAGVTNGYPDPESLSGGHMTLTVELEGESWLCDVGLTGYFTVPVPLKMSEFTQNGFCYRIEPSFLSNADYKVQNDPRTKTSRFFNFQSREVPLTAFQDKHLLLQRIKQKPYEVGLSCYHWNAGVIESIRGTNIRTVSASGRTVQRIADPKTLHEILVQRFGLSWFDSISHEQREKLFLELEKDQIAYEKKQEV